MKGEQFLSARFSLVVCMKLLIAIINNDDIKQVSKALIKNQFYSTKLASTGNFLMNGNTTLLIGCQDEEVEKVLEIIKDKAHSRKKLVTPAMSTALNMFTPNPIEVNVGGATIFVINVENFHKF